MCADLIESAQSVSPASATVGKSLRLFLALWPDDDVRGQLAALGGRWMWPAGSVLYQPGDWHVTLHFIGAVGADRVDAISSGLDVPLEPFELRLDQPQVWPRGVAVLCAGTVPHQLRQLHDRIGAALQALGLPVDARPYRAHVTLARRAAGAVAPQGVVPLHWRARGYALVVSTGEKGQRYRMLRRYGGCGQD